MHPRSLWLIESSPVLRTVNVGCMELSLNGNADNVVQIVAETKRIEAILVEAELYHLYQIQYFTFQKSRVSQKVR